MKESWLTKRLAAFVLAPCVALAGFAIALPATFFPVAEKANATDRAATDHSGPIGTDNDPWPQSFPRDTSLHHESKLKSGRIALVFDFDARYTWESMGGYNFEQRNQIKQYLQNLKGAPVQVGIYTFDRFDRPDNDYPNVAWGNTPDLPATSLDNKEGFDKVMKKLDSLDATGGTKRRKPDATDNFSNQEQGLQKVINDMKKYRYTDVFLFTTGVPNRCGVKDAGCDPDAMIDQAKRDPDKKKFLEDSGVVDVKDWDKYTFDRKGVVAAALKSYELQKGTSEWPGAKLRLMHMNFYYGVNPKECPNDREKRLIEYAGYMLGKKITYTTSQGCQITFNNVNFDNGETLTDRWIAIRHSGHLNRWVTDRDWINKHPNKDVIIDACNHWHGIGVKTLTRQDGIFQDEVKLGGGDGNQMCNHVRDGKFGQTIVKWLQKASGLAVINDQVDQDLRFIKPNAGRSFKVTKVGSSTVSKKTEGDGMFDLDSTDGRVASVELAEPNPTEQITPFPDKYDQNGQPQGGLHNARCVGWNAAHKPEFFHPEDVNNAEGIPVGFKFTDEQRSKYQLAKCAMYSRPLQETQIVKQVEVKNEQIRFVIGGAPIPGTKPTEFKGTRASYTFQWKCTDPRNRSLEVANSDGIKGKGKIAEDKRTRDINGLNVSAELPAVSLGKLPVGTKCVVTETINLPYDRKTETKGSEDVKKRAKQLFTSENKVEGRYYQLTQTKETPEDGQAASSQTTATVLYHKVNKGEPVSQLVSKTYYESKKAGIKLRLKITNKEKDAGFVSAFTGVKKKQLTVPVYYNCRFMPDPTKPPELPEKNQGSYPGYVEVGWKPVPIPKGVDEYGTEVEIGYDKNHHPAWPVGAHCLFSTNVPAADMNVDSRPLNIPGFKSDDSYASTVCSKHWNATDKKVQDCGNNYFWVRSDGEQKIDLTQDFKRQYGKLEVNKILSGKAQSQGIGKSYEMNLICKQGNATLQLGKNTAKFNVTAGTPTMVSNVPVGAACSLTETKPNLDNVEVATPGTVSLDTSDILNQPKKVEVTNNFSYKKANLTVNFTSIFGGNLSDSTVQAEINKYSKKINVSCTDLDGRVTRHDFASTGNQGSSGLLVAAGSKCQVSADTSDFDVSVARPGSKPNSTVTSSYRVQVISDTVEVDVPEKGKTANIELLFSQPPAGQLSIISKVQQWPSYQTLIDRLKNIKINAAISCDGSSNDIWSANLDLDMSSPLALTGSAMPANKRCQLKLNASWPSQVDGETVLKIDGTPSAPIKNQSSMTFEFTSPAKNQGSSLVLNHTFAVAMTKAVLSVTTPQFRTSADATETDFEKMIQVPDSWTQALIAGNNQSAATVPGTVSCALDNDTKTSYSVDIPRGDHTVDLDVPRGWECSAEIASAALKIRGTDFKSWQWSQTDSSVSTPTRAHAADEVAPVRITWSSGEKPFVASLQSDYRVQLASFNLKKKVGGEGVAMIAGDRLYSVKYSCKLNNQEIQLPVPADINTPGTAALEGNSPWDATKHLKSDLGRRLSDLASERTVKIGRFQQGEWHPIDALPAGAVCTLEETDGEEKSSRWDNYWEITPGYRSREKESKCEAASDKCRPVNEASTQKVEVVLPTNQKPQENKYYDKNKDTKGFSNHPVVPETLPENFAGTMVPWNNYKFDKVQVKVNMQLEGNGAALVSDQAVNTRLYCRPPALKDINDNLVASDANAAQVIKVPLQFKKDKGNNQDWPITMTASQQVPVNYRCILAQEDIHTGDGYVSTKIEYAAGSQNQSDNTFTANQNKPEEVKAKLQELFTTKSATSGLADLDEYDSDKNLHLGENESFIAGFKVPSQVVTGSEFIDLTLTNTIQRQGVNLSAQHVLSNGIPGYYNLSSQDLASPSYKLHYECDDKYLRDANDVTKPLKYMGDLVLGGSSTSTSATTIGTGTMVFEADSKQTAGGVANAPRFVPASSSCQFQLQNTNSDPIASYPNVHLLTTGRVADDMKLDGRFNNEKKSTDRNPAALNIIPVVFEKYVPESTGSADPNETAGGTTANSGTLNPSTAPGGTAPNGSTSSTNPGTTPGGTTSSGTPVNMEPLQATLTFSTWYFTPQQVYTLRTYAVGNYADQVIGSAKFSYKYTCDYKNLPGHNFDKKEKTVEVAAGSPVRLGEPNCVTDSSGMKVCSENVVPEGTSCTVTGTQPQVPANMDYLKLVTNQVDSTKLMAFDKQGQPVGEPDFTSKAITNATVVNVDAQKRFTVSFRPAQPDEATPPPSDVSIGHIVYRNGAEIYVRRVDKPTAGQTTGTTVSGAKFDLFYSKADGAIDTSRPVTITEDGSNSGVYKATLAPGTYWLGTTDTGKGNQTELLWQRYKFEVKVTKDNACTNTDTFVELAPETKHSGLVDLQQRQLENTPTAAGTGTTTPASGTGAGTNPATPGSTSTSPASPSTPTTPSSGTTSGTAAPPEPQCLVNAAPGFTKWDVDVADIRFGDLPLTGGRMPWLLGAAGTMLAGAVALMIRNRRRDVNNA
ncbi:LPXTG-motif cell wall anchor domain protein [Mobiluncus mulieris 28-1]|uniref:DUF5979 domain-containing protein n=1 Tax=Mobiluncus mulieris TaxID=2052 RepID=UPI0001BE7E75|nr:DUF5979 domain-containing protein [Mobiluncus mulieris]EEZ91235.1 LPXTG-motif cell wall anchor domain protein [Mobiluncus mulieris 28-1]